MGQIDIKLKGKVQTETFMSSDFEKNTIEPAKVGVEMGS